MFYNYFDKFFQTHHIQQVRQEIEPYFSRPIKSTAIDTEIDLTLDQAIPETKLIVEQVVSEFFNQELVCYNYWISMSFFGESVIEHHHVDPGSGAYASAVVYVQANKKSGNLTLKDFDKTFTPAAGDLVVFPASCIHYVSENNSLEPRICVAFDFKKSSAAGSATK